MTTLFTDDFNRADSGTLGANWTNVDAGFVVASNTAKASTAGLNSVIVTSVSFPADQWAQITLGATVSTNSDEGYGLVLRGAAGGDLYFLHVSTVDSHFYSRVGGTYNDISGAQTGGTTGDVFYAEIQGTTIIVKKNGSQIWTSTDSAISSGAPGLWGDSGGGLINGDNFSAGDFGGGAVADNPRRYQDDIPAAYFTDPGWAAIWGPQQFGITVANRSGAAGGVSAADGSITAANTTTGVGAATQKANASDTNTGTLTGVGAATAKADASSTAQLTLTGVGRATVSGAGSITAVKSQTGVGASTAKAAASDTNTTTLTGVGAATASAAAGATGVLTLTGQGAAVGSGAGDGTITITSGMTGAGASKAAAAGFTLRTTDATLVLGLNLDGDFTDVSAYGHVLTNNGVTTSSAQFKAGTASGLFTTTGTEIHAAATAEWAFSTATGTTWQAWVYPTTVDATRRSLWDWRFDGTGSGTTLSLDFTASDIRFQVGIGSTLWTCQLTTGSLTVNTWQHVRTSLDGPIMRLFIDGVQVATTTITSPGALNGSTGGSLPMWGRKNDSTQNYGGYMDLIQVHGSCLDPGATSFTPAASILTPPAEFSGLFGVGATQSPTVNAADGAITLTGGLAGVGAATAKADASDTNVFTLSGVASSAGPVIVSADGGITIVGTLTGTGAAKAGAAGSVSMAGNLYGNTDLSAGGSDTGGGKKRKRRGQIDLERDEEEMLEIAALIVPLLGSSAWAR